MEIKTLLWVTALALWLGLGLAWSQNEKVLLRCRSPFNDLKVIQMGHERILKVRKGSVYVEESRCDMRRPAHLVHQYSRLQMLGTLFPEELSQCLVVGLGGGSLSKALALNYPQMSIDSLELDPEIARLAQQYFDYQSDEKRRCIVSDARDFLRTTSKCYDLIFLDAFDGLEIPASLRTVEFYDLVKEHLKPGGVVVSNLHRDSRTYARDRSSLAQVFRESLGFDGFGLVIVLSSQRPLWLQSQRWQESWGFDWSPLAKLQQAAPDFDPQAPAFRD